MPASPNPPLPLPFPVEHTHARTHTRAHRGLHCGGEGPPRQAALLAHRRVQRVQRLLDERHPLAQLLALRVLVVLVVAQVDRILLHHLLLLLVLLLSLPPRLLWLLPHVLLLLRLPLASLVLWEVMQQLLHAATAASTATAPARPGGGSRRHRRPTGCLAAGLCARRVPRRPDAPLLQHLHLHLPPAGKQVCRCALVHLQMGRR